MLFFSINLTNLYKSKKLLKFDVDTDKIVSLLVSMVEKMNIRRYTFYILKNIIVLEINKY